MAQSSVKKILLLEDNEDLLYLEVALIDSLPGCKAIPTRNFAEVKNLQPPAVTCDLALLDVNLGFNQPTGVEVYRWLRSQGFNKSVYFLTGHASDFEPVAQAAKLADTVVLSKPIEASKLMDIIRGSL